MRHWHSIFRASIRINAASLREHVVALMRSDPAAYRSFVIDEHFSDFLRRMGKSHEWAEHVVLAAMADLLQGNHFLLQSHKLSSALFY